MDAKAAMVGPSFLRCWRSAEEMATVEFGLVPRMQKTVSTLADLPAVGSPSEGPIVAVAAEMVRVRVQATRVVRKAGMD